MTTREMIRAEIEKVREEDLDALYEVVKGFSLAQANSRKSGLLSRLKDISIDAPDDFAANLDLYLSGEKRAETLR